MSSEASVGNNERLSSSGSEGLWQELLLHRGTRWRASCQDLCFTLAAYRRRNNAGAGGIRKVLLLVHSRKHCRKTLTEQANGNGIDKILELDIDWFVLH